MSALLRRMGRIPHFRLNFIRTFVNPSRAPETDRKPELKQVNTEKGKYKLLKMTDHIHMLFISNPNEMSFGNIRVQVGCHDNPEARPGLSHLSEHLVVRTLLQSYGLSGSFSGQTYEDHTAYKFSECTDFWKTFKIFSKLLFDTTLVQKISVKPKREKERKQVNAEFHISRTTDTNERMNEIYKLNGLPMPGFGMGNYASLYAEDDVLRTELIAHFKLYQKRPVFVCICSPQPMDEIERKFKENFWIYENYSADEERREPRAAKEYSGVSEENKKNNFLVVKSNYEDLQLRIFFPFFRSFSLLQQNTLACIGCLVQTNAPTVYCLRDYLLQNKIGTGCDFEVQTFGLVVMVDLCSHEKDEVSKVIATVIQYYKWIHENWDKIIDKRVTSKILGVAPFACEYFMDLQKQVMSEEMDENFFTNLDGLVSSEDAKAMLQHLILANENSVYSIVTQETEKVLREFVGNESITPTLEKHYETQFYSLPGSHLDLSAEGYWKPTDEDKPDMEFEYGGDVTFLVENFRDTACQRLVVADNQIRIGEDMILTEILFVSDYEYHTSAGEEIKSLKQYAVEAPSLEDFEYTKKFALRYLSKNLIESLRLAKSLLTVAVLNSCYPSLEIKPIPTIYKEMRETTLNDYNLYLKTLQQEPVAVTLVESEAEEEMSIEFPIKSINEDERNTVTLYFIIEERKKIEEVDELEEMLRLAVREEMLRRLKNEVRNIKNDYGIYTLNCEHVKFGCIGGILLELQTVEEDNSCELVRSEIVPNLIDSVYGKVETISVQVIGNKKPTTQAEISFDQKFDHWFDEHQSQFDRILNPRLLRADTQSKERERE